MKRLRNWLYGASAIVVLSAVAIGVLAQEYPSHRGNGNRVGRHDGDQALTNPGRSFLRWWSPLGEVKTEIDNTDVSTVAIPPGDWYAPSGIEASNFVEATATFPPYRYAFTVASKDFDEPNIPKPGDQLRTFEWRFGGVNQGQEYALYVNLPIGPTDDDPGNGISLVYPQRYYVYEIDGVVNPDNPGAPIVTQLDNYAVGGGYARLGYPNFSTDTLFVADNTGVITIRLINTVPRNGQNALTDTPYTTVVYADSALMVRGSGTSAGSYAASPIVGELKTAPLVPADHLWRVVSSRNEETSVQAGNNIRTFSVGHVNSDRHDGYNINPADDGFGQRNNKWSFPARKPWADTTAERQRYAVDTRNWINGTSPMPGPSRAIHWTNKDNLSSDVMPTFGWLLDNTTPNYYGLNYLVTPTVIGAPTETVTYRPKLNDGRYSIYVWLPGNSGLPHAVEYQVFQGALLTRITVDQSAANTGWFRLQLGPQTTFNHNENSAPLRVVITNRSSDPDDVGTSVYADAVRFERDADLRAASTPVMATVGVRVTPNGPIVQRDVVIQAYENGRIYCMDAKGNPDGTTNVYWCYPTEDESNDPNRVVGEDGPGGIAENPIGFDISSATVQRVNTGSGNEDLLYIANKNGRVYCIEVAGRGDGSATRYGTTRRRWSYPNDYPQLPVDSALGQITGSVAFSVTSAGPTVFVPAGQGRMYALDAVGDGSAKTTTVRWTYPDLASPTLGTIGMTPAVEFNRVYFGASNGEFYALNADTGAVVWNYAAGSPFTVASPATVPDVTFDGVGNMPDSVFFMDQLRLYCANAATGAILWSTNELGASPGGSITFTYLSPYNNLGIPVPNTPCVVVPTLDGRVTALFAVTGTTNLNGLRRAWGYQTAGQVRASIATGARRTTPAPPFPPGLVTPEAHGWMYCVDDLGYLYAFNHDPSRSDNNQQITPGVPPGQQQIVENDPSNADLARYAQTAKVAVLCPSDYEDLVTKVRTSTLTYGNVTNYAANEIARRNFEYGETMYMLIYDIPNPTDATNPLNPPLNSMIVQTQFSSPGQSAQRRSMRIYPAGSGSPPERNGVAFVAFPLLGTGANAMAPGLSNMITSLVIQGQGGAGRQLGTRYGRINFQLANPLAVIGAPQTVANRIGNSTDAANLENLNNGNDVPGTGYKRVVAALGPDFTAPGDKIAHGQSSSTKLIVQDRSMMRLLYGDTRGLANVKFDIADLAWIAPAGDPNFGVIKPLNPTIYPQFEDYPNQVPNISIEYPDIRREGLSITKDVFGTVENPLFTPVTLNPPTWTGGEFNTYRTRTGFEAQMINRVLQNTEFDLVMNTPRFQPPGSLPYEGAQYVYVEANAPGRNFSGNVAQEAYRNFNITADVAIDERLVVQTPTIDMGSLPGGAGFFGADGLPGPMQYPWDLLPGFRFWLPQPAPAGFFQPFVVVNEGNVNLTNVRIAKFIARDTSLNAVYDPVRLSATGLNENAYLDAYVHLHSDLDPKYAPFELGRRVILQKGRPGDSAGTRLSVNAPRRQNANLNVGTGWALPSPVDPSLPNPIYPPGDPRVAVSVPIGAPSGSYLTPIYVFEDNFIPPQSSAQDPGLGSNGFGQAFYEPYAEPGFTLKFNVRETRVTGSYTTYAAPVADWFSLSGTATHFWANRQPAVTRYGNGNLLMAWSSNRLLDNNTPGWDARQRIDADASRPDEWRIYIGMIRGATPDAASVPGSNTLRDLNGFTADPSVPLRWMTHQVGPFPGTAPNALFNVQPGETIEPGTLNFGNPVFPGSGFFDPLNPMGNLGRTLFNSFQMVFNGEATIRDARGQRRTEYRLFTCELQVDSNNAITMGPVVPMPYDPEVRKSTPSTVQTARNVTAFYTTNAVGLGQISYSSYPVGGGWSSPAGLNLSNGFESVGSPSAILRRYQNRNNEAVIDLLFTAKLRGRANVEAWLGRLSASSATGRPQGRNPVLAFPRRTGSLTLDVPSGIYWTQGVEWNLGQDDTDPNRVNTRIDIFESDGTANPPSILDWTTMKLDSDSGILNFDCRYGGKCYIDTTNGSVRFSSAIIPRNSKLVVRYRPKFLRVSQGLGANYKNAQLLFDERFTSEFAYWANTNNLAAVPGDPARVDRYVMTYGRSSADGSSASRPYIRTVRFGIQLPTGVQTNSNGDIVQINVTGLAPGTFYQIEPATGKIYVSSENEDRVINVTYRGVDESGAPYPNPITMNGVVATVMAEQQEVAIPIEQVTNESSVAIALDPQNSPFNRVGLLRAGLMWVVWSSTRAGNTDLFFQTLAPRFTPRLPSR